jgi:rod shape-determining protein MreD
MRWFRFAILTFIALILQTTVLPVMLPDGMRPWALVVLANIYLLTRPDEWTILQVWLIGFLGDMTSICPLGSQALAFGLYGLLITTLRPLLFTDSSLAQGVTTGIGVIVISGTYALLAFLTRSGLPLPSSTTEVLGQALASGLAAALIVKFFIPRRQLSSRRW